MDLNSATIIKGKTIVITRAQEQSREPRQLLENLGARVLDLPALIIGPPDDWNGLDFALRDLETFDWLIFSSINGVKAVEERLRLMDKKLSSFSKSLNVAAVGKKTSFYLNQIAVSVDFVPPNYVADSLLSNFPTPCSGLKILLPRVQSGGRTILSEGFSKLGASVIEVSAYESRCPNDIPSETSNAFLSSEVNIIAFTSSKTVLNTVNLMKGEFGDKWLIMFRHIKIVSIGPQTSLTCYKYFSRCDIEADPHDMNGLIKACLDISSS